MLLGIQQWHFSQLYQHRSEISSSVCDQCFEGGISWATLAFWYQVLHVFYIVFGLWAKIEHIRFFVLWCTGNLQRNKLRADNRWWKTKEQDHYSVQNNLAQLKSSPSLPSTLVCIFCACSEFIFIIAHTKAISKAEDNRGLINVMAYHIHHSVPLYCWPLIPAHVLMWPPIRYQQWGMIAYNPHRIPSKFTAGAVPKSSFPAINLFSLKKVSEDEPSETLLSIHRFHPRWSIHPHCAKKKMAPSPDWSSTSSLIFIPPNKIGSPITRRIW